MVITIGWRKTVLLYMKHLFILVCFTFRSRRGSGAGDEYEAHKKLVN